MTVALLVAAGVVALGDWVAVARRLRRTEYALKPLTLALLVAAAFTLHLGPAQPWLVAGLCCGLAGDVALLVARGPGDDAGGTDVAFLAGLAAFLAGHVLYAVGFVRSGVVGVDLLAGLLVVLAVSVPALPPVLRGAARTSGPPFAAVVAGYAAVLAVMTVLAVGTGRAATAVGGALFLVSDTVLATQRFVRPRRGGDLAVIVTYHAAQVLILLGLRRAAA